MTSQKKRIVFVALIAVGVIAIGVFIFAAHDWYYSEVEHRRLTSPNGRLVVIITKRMVAFFKPVEIRVKVVQNGGRERTYLDVFLEERDLWGDVGLESFPIEWKSNEEFQVKGWSRLGGGECFRGRLVDDFWAVASIR